MRWYIALRYLLSHKRQTLVCIAGVTISVMMFITMDAMMEGFEDKFIVETVESSGHITVHDEPRETRTKILERIYTNPNALLAVSNVKPREDVKKIKNAAGLIQELRHLRGIVAAAPEVDGDAIATYGTKTLTVSILGIDPEQQQKVTTIGKDVVDGNFTRLHSTADGVVIGRGVSDLLGAKLDDEITLAGTTGGRTTSRVVGIFATGVTPVDYSRVYMLINSAQTLLDRKNVINDIIIRTSDYTRAQYYAAQIESIAGYKTESWQESNANFLKIFTVQSIITYIITGALLVVAAFGVLNILIMAVLERVNDIAILKSFGLSRADITWIYVFQGLMIGLIGTVLGEIVGKLGIEGLRRLPIQIEGLVKSEGLLMSESRQTYIVAFFCSMIVVLLAAVYPARRAAKYDPVEVIRGATETLSAEMLAEMLAAPAAIDAPLLEARNVRRVLGTGDMATEVLRGVNLIIRRGEYLSIVGSSGSGKSTLLYLLGGLDRPTRIDVHGRLYDPSSHIYMEEHDTALLTERELALLRNRLVGFVFQFHYLLKEFTAQENVALPMFKLGRLTRNAAMDRAASLLKRLGLSDKIKRRANRLSGGEQQRVAIARALANEPRVLLADEPTGNLDRRNGDLIADIFNELHAGGQSIVMVTHDGALAKRACRRITMDDGRITADEGFVR